jgi:formylglycine-generating enzyme required for sulfatase activity
VIIGISVAVMATGAAAWWSQHPPKEEVQPQTNVTAPEPAQQKEETHPQTTATAQEHALEAGDSSKECGNCPEMVTVPAGRFLMSSPVGPGMDDEKHEVTIAKPFAVAKFALTFDEWDACAAQGGCRRDVSDNGWGRGRRPVINVSWDDAQEYVKWLSSITGKPYRLLSEAEYEYAARAGSQTTYPWGNRITLNGKPMANCDGCGSQWDNKQTAPVGSFPANGFGLYDVIGNVWEWVEDCENAGNQGAPLDGSPWASGDCSRRVLRGGSWFNYSYDLRSALRRVDLTDVRLNSFGFRVARTLSS